MCRRNIPIAELKLLEKDISGENRLIGLAKGDFTVTTSFFEPIPDDNISSNNGGQMTNCESSVCFCGRGGTAGQWIKPMLKNISKDCSYMVTVGYPGGGGVTGGRTALDIVDGNTVIEAAGGAGGGTGGHFFCQGKLSGHPAGYGNGGDGTCSDGTHNFAKSGYIRITYTAYVQ